MNINDDFEIYQRVKARVERGVALDREATRAEWMAVLRVAVRLDAALTVLADSQKKTTPLAKEGAT